MSELVKFGDESAAGRWAKTNQSLVSFTPERLALSKIKLVKRTIAKQFPKYIHLAGNSIFMKRMCVLLEKHFCPEEHLFLLLEAYDHGRQQYPDFALPVSRELLEDAVVAHILSGARKIFLHSFWSDEFTRLLLKIPGAPEKTDWIAWGADLYDYKATPLRRELASRLHGVIAHLPEEWKLACEKYEADLIWTGWGPFYDSGEMEDAYGAFNMRGSARKSVNVLVGHRAYPGLSHEEVFQLLARKFPGKLDVYTVLAYGDPEYARQVLSSGQRIFGNRFHPVTTFMPAAHYYTFLDKMDVGIFAQERSQGLGNITCLLYQGKKVFLKENTPNVRFLSMLGAKTAPLEQLEGMDLDEFMSNPDARINHLAMKRLKSGELARTEWRKILNGTPLPAAEEKLPPAYAEYSAERLKKLAKDDFWNQVRRTRNGQIFPDEQMDLIYGTIRDALDFQPNDVLLDLACGNGRLSHEFMPLLGSCHGVDLSPLLIEIANENFASDKSSFAESDIEDWLEKEPEPERFSKCLFYGAIAYFTIPSIYHILLLLHRRFKNIGRVFIGPVPDRDKCAQFYRTDDYDPNDHTSSIGMWHRREDFKKIAKDCGWEARILDLPDASWHAAYRFNTELTRLPGAGQEFNGEKKN